MRTPAISPDISTADRLGVTIFFAVVAHLIVILGVTFAPEDRPGRRVDALDVVLVPWRSETVPDRPDYLAQVNSASPPALSPEGSPVPTPASIPDAVMAASGIETASTEPAQPPADSRPEREPIGSRPAGQPARPEPGRTREASRAADSAPATVPETPARGIDTPEDRSLAMAALSAEIERKLRAYAERPRRKWISARTREHRFAVYMHAWRSRVESIGNLHYPDEAARRGLSGNLLLDVALNSDGTIENITLRRSSGEWILDDAAVRIVQLAAPFPAFPEDIAEEVDVLHIERTWIFHSNNRFGSH